MLRPALALALLLIAVPVLADETRTGDGGDWKVYYTIESPGGHFAYDALSITNAPDGKLTVWTLRTFDHWVRDARFLYELDCPNRRFRLLRDVVDGVSTDHTHDPWPVEYDDYTRKLYRTLCK